MKPEKSYRWQQKKPDPNIKYTLVKFKKPTEEFVGNDMRIYGPFESGDMCRVPVLMEGVLEDQGRV